MRTTLLILSTIGLLGCTVERQPVSDSRIDEPVDITRCDGLIEPRLISRPEPRYSEDIRQAAHAWGQETYLDLEVVVGRDGAVIHVAGLRTQPINDPRAKQFQAESRLVALFEASISRFTLRRLLRRSHGSHRQQVPRLGNESEQAISARLPCGAWVGA